MLKVVELPHPNDLTFHALAGIDSPLIHWAILTFLVQLWQKGDLVCMVAGELPDTTGKILSIDMQNQSTVIVMDRPVLPRPYRMILRGGMMVLEGAGILARGTGFCT